MAPPETREFPLQLPNPRDSKNATENNLEPIEKSHTVDEALSLLGFGRVQLAITCLAAFCLFGINNEIMGWDYISLKTISIVLIV